MEFGGDGIYAASRLIHQEPAVKKYKIGKMSNKTPIAKNYKNNCSCLLQTKVIKEKLMFK